MTRPARPRPAHALARHLPALALGGVLLTGCTTIRAPAGQIAGAVPVRDGRAEPQAALWIESGKPVTPQEQAEVHAKARAALELALANRPPLPGDPLVVVREQGVTRTRSHRRDQEVAVAGAVVGAVVVVAAVAVAASSDHGGSSHASHASAASGARAPRGASLSKVPAPRPSGGGFRPPSPRAVPAPGFRPPTYAAAPAPGFAGHGGHAHGWDTTVAFGFGLDFTAVGQPETEVVYGPWAGPPPYAAAAALPPPPMDLPPPPDAEPAAPLEQAPPEVQEVALAPVVPLAVDQRGFFDGDVLELDVTLVDRYTGEPLWWKRVRKDADPLDAPAVRRAVSEALRDEGWLPPPPLPAGRPAAAPGPAPVPSA
ncbi:MAG: hypothetical protein QM767_06330 [Anaeromyxobacter sp.]